MSDQESIKSVSDQESIKGLPASLAKVIQKYASTYHDWMCIGTPWISEGSLSWLDVNLKPTDRVLEYGGGRSTLYYASKCECVTCVEADPDWAFYVMMYAYEHPALIKKLRLHFVPAAWNPNFESGLKPFWKNNRGAITRNDGFLLERDLLQTEFPNHNILCLGGTTRPLLMTHKLSTLDFSKIDIIIVENTEGAVTSYMCDALMLDDFERLDFPDESKDVTPAHQKGKIMTSIFVKPSRQYQEVNTWTPPRMTEEERRKHMAENTESIEKAHSRVNTMKKYISEKLGL